MKDVSNDQLDLFKEVEVPVDEAKIVESISVIEGIWHSQMSDMKWIFNDNLIMMITDDN
jgi:hypothetical protein